MLVEMEQGTIHIPAGQTTLEGELQVTESARGIVLFAHGSGSSRFSPRNQRVAAVLRQCGFATLLMDLLTHEEEQRDLRTAALRFNIELLAERLISAALWLNQRDPHRLPLGFFGASTGAAAALIAAAKLPDLTGAVVSRGGRPDLAVSALASVRAPTLLIIGGNDPAVIPLNRAAFAELACEKELKILPGASHLFEEAGALEKVAELTCSWFSQHLGSYQC